MTEGFDDFNLEADFRVLSHHLDLQTFGAVAKKPFAIVSEADRNDVGTAVGVAAEPPVGCFVEGGLDFFGAELSEHKLIFAVSGAEAKSGLGSHRNQGRA